METNIDLTNSEDYDDTPNCASQLDYETAYGQLLQENLEQAVIIKALVFYIKEGKE